MGDVLLVSSKLSERDFLKRSLLRAGDFMHIVMAPGGSEARRLLMLHPFDLVIVNTPLQDEFGYKLATDLSEASEAFVIMVARESDSWDDAEEAGVFVMLRPLQENLLEYCIKLICLVNRRNKNMLSENRKLQRQINELRTISRAKCLLVQRENMTEEEAHHFIEKQAMNRRITRLAVSKEIIEGIA